MVGHMLKGMEGLDNPDEIRGLLGVGLALGLVGSAVLARAIRGMLFGVPAADPVTFFGVAVVVLAVGLAACAGPALRAARVDPLVAMRAE